MLLVLFLLASFNLFERHVPRIIHQPRRSPRVAPAYWDLSLQPPVQMEWLVLSQIGTYTQRPPIR